MQRSGVHIALLGLDALAAAAALLGAPGCSAAPIAAEVPARPSVAAPLVRVSVQSRLHQTLQVGDRVPGFDRLSLSAPAAVLYDEKRDVYWVSNSNGAGPDDNGFISRLDPEGNVMTLNFIDGARPETTLHSPTGLALKNDRLLVTDVTALREFDADTGKALGKLEIPGAKHLNDVAVAPDGSVFIADLGADSDVAGTDRSGKDAVYRITPTGALVTLLKGAELRGPSALFADPSGLWLVGVGGDLVHLLSGNGSSGSGSSGSGSSGSGSSGSGSSGSSGSGSSGKGSSGKGLSGDGSSLPTAHDSVSNGAGQRYPLGLGTLRGLTRIPDGTFLVSGWEGESIWRGVPGGSFETVIDGLEAPADLGYDTKRQRVLIPLFNGHALAVFDLPPFGGASSGAPQPAPNRAPEPAPPAAERRGPAS